MSAPARFPFPFRGDSFRYSTNVEPARAHVATEAGGWGSHIVDVDEDYLADLALRQRILAAEPRRGVVSDHMRPAAWDALLVVLAELAASCPARMSLSRDGDGWRWTNALLGVEQGFVFGAEDSLPMPPLLFAASQVQDDLVLLDQRGDTLYADAGVVTFAADWSLPFVIGMTFLDLHAPVPDVLHRERVIKRAHELLLRLQAGAEIRRTNWLMTVGRHLDLSTERLPVWGPHRARALESDLGETLQLRVELQHLIRLPTTGAIMFTIRTYHLSMAELATVPAWLRRFRAVLAELPGELIDAKGMTDYHAVLLDWLASADRS